jgi:hypothetical protein
MSNQSTATAFGGSNTEAAAGSTATAFGRSNTEAMAPLSSTPLAAPFVYAFIYTASPAYLAPGATPGRGLRINTFSVAQVVNVVYAD